jgi:predicted RNA methylase
MLRVALPQRRAVPAADTSGEPFEHMREQLRQGIKVASVPQLFPTPRELALRLVDEAKVCAGERVLEPSAGTGELVSAIISRGLMGLERGQVVAVELNHTLAEALRTRRSKTLYASEENYDVRCADFLQCTVEQMGTFHRVVMNPPFDDEVAHVTHALGFLKPGGRLVSVMSTGVLFRQDRKTAAFRELLEQRGGTIERLPDGSFEQSGTSVHTVLVTIDSEDSL